MTDERGWALLDAYLAHECSEGDAEAMRHWLARTPAAWDAAQVLQGVTVHPEVDGIPFDEDYLFQRITDALPAMRTPVVRTVGSMRQEPNSTSPHLRTQAERPRRSTPLHRPFRSSKATWAVVCAVIGIVVGVVGYRATTSWFAPTAQREYSTTRGQQINVTLDDNTEVWLAPDTRLEYTPAGRSTPRVVTLKGEAVFHVQHADRIPFVVQSAGVDVRVLGTTFGVRSYQEDSTVRIAILDGKVAVKDRILTAGDVAWAHGAQNEVRVQHHQPISALTGWRSGQLAFVGVRLDEVLPSLARWYDLEFVLADPKLAERRVSATLDAKHLTTEDLDFLSISLGARYLRLGRTITFYPQMP